MNGQINVGEAVRKSWECVMREPVTLILGNLVGGFIIAFSVGICAGPVMLGYYRTCLKVSRNEPVTFNDVFSGFNQFGPAFLVAFLVFLALIAMCIAVMVITFPLNLVLNFIPIIGFLISLPLNFAIGAVIGLCFQVMTMWAWPVLADGEPDPMAALRRAYEIGRANLNSGLLLAFVGTAISFAGLLACGVGTLITGPMFFMMYAIAYDQLGGAGSVVETALPVV